MKVKLNVNKIKGVFSADEFRDNVGIEPLLKNKYELEELAYTMLEDIFIQIGAESESFTKSLVSDDCGNVASIDNSYSKFSINLIPSLIRSLRSIDKEIEINDLKLITRASGLNVLMDFTKETLTHYGYEVEIDDDFILKVCVKNKVEELDCDWPNPFE